MEDALPDVLHHLGRRYALVERPLDAYFNLIGERPRLQMPTATLDVPYRARWVIEDGWFYLIALEGHWHDGAQLRLHQMFPFAGPKVFAAWMSGTVHGYRADTVSSLPDIDSPTLRRYPDVVLTMHCGRVASAGSRSEIRSQLSTRLAFAQSRKAANAASAEQTAHENMNMV